MTLLEAEPETVGKRLLGRLEGSWSARVGSYRVLYTIEPSGVVEIPARQGRDHLMAVLHRVQNAPRRTGDADLAQGIRRLLSPSHRRGLAVVVSDLLAPAGCMVLRDLAGAGRRQAWRV